MHNVLYSDDFVRGLNDCKEGKPRKPNQSEGYDKGYTIQYQNDRVKGEGSEQKINIK